MRTKITLILTLLILPFISNNLFSQTVSGIPSTNGCQSGGIVTSSSTGLGATPQYQLLRAGVVVSPVSGDNTQFTTNPVFTGLISGTYTVNGRATAGGTVYSSSNITVADGYTAMTVTTPTIFANCIGGTGVLTTTVTNGKAPFTYTIATQTAPGTILQNSGAIAANTFTFNGLPANNYIVSVTDSCGLTVTGATSISNPAVTLNDVKIATYAFPTRNALSCSQRIRLNIEKGFVYVSNNNVLSPQDAELFRWKIKYKGQLYGEDTDGDGYADLNGAGFQLSNISPAMPLIATRDQVVADIPNMQVVLIDKCGLTKEFGVIDYNASFSYITLSNCAGTAVIKAQIAAGLDCLPVNVTFTNNTNPSDIHTITITGGSQIFTNSLVPGATYNVTYIDGEGYTNNLFMPASSVLTFSSTPTFFVSQNVSQAGTSISLNYLNYGSLYLGIIPFQPSDILSYTVTASNNPLVPIGYSYSAEFSSYTNGSNGVPRLPSPNPTDPATFWPKGNYTLQVTSNCGTMPVNVVVQGRTASLSGYTTTPVCGGFNYVMNGNFDDQTAYEVQIISGPSSVGEKRDMVWKYNNCKPECNY